VRSGSKAASSEVALTFEPEGFIIRARSGDTILDAALDNGIDLPHECGGNCACTTCHVVVLEGAEYLSPMEEVEIDRLHGADGWKPLSRLGCQAILGDGSVKVRIVESEVV